MNHEKKSPDTRRAILWGVGGAYILYLSYDLLQGYFSGEATAQKDVLLCTIGGGVFLLIGIVLVILALRQGMAALRAQAAEMDRIEAEERAALEAKATEDEDGPQA